MRHTSEGPHSTFIASNTMRTLPTRLLWRSYKMFFSHVYLEPEITMLRDRFSTSTTPANSVEIFSHANASIWAITGPPAVSCCQICQSKLVGRGSCWVSSHCLNCLFRIVWDISLSCRPWHVGFIRSAVCTEDISVLDSLESKCICSNPILQRP